MHKETQKTILSQDGVTLCYKILRNNESQTALLMLHGLASNHTRWSEFVEHTQLNMSWNLLRTDLRGHGCSMTSYRLSRQQWCRDLKAILATEGLEQAVIVGHSLGAQIAIEFAIRYSQHTRVLILIDPVFPSLLKGVLGWAKKFRSLLWLAIHCLKLFKRLGMGHRSYPQRDLKQLDEQTRERLAASDEAEIAHLYMNPLADLKYMPLTNYLQDVFEVVRPLPRLEKVTQPVWVLLSAGAELSERRRVEQMINRFAQAQTILIHADHWPLTEKPEEVRRVIETICSEKLTD